MGLTTNWILIFSLPVLGFGLARASSSLDEQSGGSVRPVNQRLKTPSA